MAKVTNPSFGYPNFGYPVIPRYACGIDLGTSYVVTGGVYSEQRVTQYSLTGEVTELPELINARYHHACSSFQNTEGVTVRYKYINVRK